MQNACTDECAVARNFKPQLDHALRLTQPCFATGGITFDPLQVSQKLRFITGGSRRTSRLCGCWRRCNRYGACHGGHRKGCFALGDADRCFFLDGRGEFISGDFITALLAEAFRLLADDVVSPADLDALVKDGLGLRWSFMGPIETIDLNAVPDRKSVV